MKSSNQFRPPIYTSKYTPFQSQRGSFNTSTSYTPAAQSTSKPQPPNAVTANAPTVHQHIDSSNSSTQHLQTLTRLQTERINQLEQLTSLLNDCLLKAKNTLKNLQNTAQVHHENFTNISTQITTIKCQVKTSDDHIGKILSNQEVAMHRETTRDKQLNLILKQLTMVKETSASMITEQRFPDPYQHVPISSSHSPQTHWNSTLHPNNTGLSDAYYPQSECSLQSIPNMNLISSRTTEMIVMTLSSTITIPSNMMINSILITLLLHLIRIYHILSPG